MVYAPDEDSFLLSSAIEKCLKKLKNKNIKALDMGTGSGIQSLVISKFIDRKNILALDINSEAVRQAKSLGFLAIISNLFSKIKKKFDLIVFNPPYLPSSKFDNEKDTTGGKQGDETILKFLKQVKKHLNKSGKILLLLSSLTPRKRILQELKKQKLQHKTIASKKIFFEQLEVWEISLV